MRLLERFAFLLLFASVCASAETSAIDAATVDTSELHYKVDGKRITTYVHLFTESPYNNPKLIEQIQKAGLDHVVFLDEEKEQSRDPSGLGDLAALHEEIEKIKNLPIVDIKQKKGFFKKLGQLWNVSFNRSTRAPKKADYTFGLVSTGGEAAMTTIMVLAAPGIGLENAIGLVVASSALAYVNNTWNLGIQHFLSGGKANLDQGAQSLKYWARSLIYDYVQSQALKWIQVGSDIGTWGVQSTILMNTVVSGIGDVKLNNNIYKAYGDDPVKLARANYYINSISSTFASIDLMQSRLLPVIMEIGAYELRWSAPILIGYYITANYMLKKHPDQVYKVVDFIHQTIQKVKQGFRSVGRFCNDIFVGKSPQLPGPNDGAAI